MGGRLRCKKPVLVEVVIPDITLQERMHRFAQLETMAGNIRKQNGHEDAKCFTYCAYDEQQDKLIYHFSADAK
ncbi:MAG: hypothetical protein VB100_10570 [Angelakisella sp.]|nr:hypothetical protein [Angelakisella sp.]